MQIDTVINGLVFRTTDNGACIAYRDYDFARCLCMKTVQIMYCTCRTCFDQWRTKIFIACPHSNMLTRDIDITILSVGLSVCLSVTFQYCRPIETA